MKQSKFTEEQIIRALRQQEAREKTVAEICRELGISQATFFKWKQKFGGMSVKDAKRLKELEQETARLQRLVGKLSMEKEILEEIVKKL